MLIKNIPLGISVSFLSYTSFALMDMINKFLFSYEIISFFSYMFWLDIAIILSLLIIAITTTKIGLDIFKTKNILPIFIRSLFSVINTLCSLLAISKLPFHIFYSLTFMQPIIATILSFIFLIEKPKLNKIFLILFGFTGMIISIEIWNFEKTALPIIGIIGGLGVAISGAFSGIVIKKYLPTENAITIALYNILLSLFVASIYLSFSEDKLFITSNFKTISLIAVAGVLASLGILFFMISYQKASVQSIVSMQYIQIVWGIIFGIMVFNQIPSFFSIIGAIIIILSNYLNLKENKINDK